MTMGTHSFRIDGDIWHKFQELCRLRRTKPAGAVRVFVERVVENELLLDLALSPYPANIIATKVVYYPTLTHMTEPQLELPSE